MTRGGGASRVPGSRASRVRVAAGVILAPDGRFLLAQRPPGKPYAGYWEFPGGKIEYGEAAAAALERELVEELGIRVERAYPWITRDYDYPHARVRLHFFRVVTWSGVPHGREAQAFVWQPADAISVSPLLPANGPVLRALALPSVYGISRAAETGSAVFLSRLDAALGAGLRLFQFREKQLPRGEARGLAERAMAAARRHGARMLVNSDIALARELGADGVHLTAAELAQCRERPAFDLVGASCHDAQELRRAAELGADFVVLGPVEPTPSHSGQPVLGWERFARLAADYPIPVFALGGMQPHHLPQAWRAGAHGIAMMRGAWDAKPQ